MKANTPPSCHLFVILARESPKAVILRKGPTKWVRLISWDTEHDTFDLGQWIKGRVYERRCDLSPNGSKFIYFILQVSGSNSDDPEYTFAWTAISTPPYFTALVLWPKFETYFGGGLFETENKVWLPESISPHKDHMPPEDLEVISSPDARVDEEPVYFKRLARDGWSVIQEAVWGNLHYSFEQSQIWQKINPTNQYSLVMEWFGWDSKMSGGPYRLKFSLRSKSGTLNLPIDADTWADWDHQGRLVYAKDGSLFAATVTDNRIESKLLADFTAQKPEAIPSPEWAKTWD